jgi:hypothetical protein
VYDPKQLSQGVVLNAAVLLNDPKQMEHTMADIEAAAKPGASPAGHLLAEGSGIIGQFVTLARIVLTPRC